MGSNSLFLVCESSVPFRSGPLFHALITDRRVRGPRQRRRQQQRVLHRECRDVPGLTARLDAEVHLPYRLFPLPSRAISRTHPQNPSLYVVDEPCFTLIVLVPNTHVSLDGIGHQMLRGRNRSDLLDVQTASMSVIF
jgi:hypothetical protein